MTVADTTASASGVPMVEDTGEGRARAADQKATLALWLGGQYERIGRFAEAEAAYVRALDAAASDSIREQAQGHITSILTRQEGWFSRNVSPSLGSGVRAGLTTVFTVLIGGTVMLVVILSLRPLARWWGRRRGKHRLTIEPFARYLPEDVVLGIEDTIVEMHGRMRRLLQPLGILWSISMAQGGSRLPLISTTSPGGEIAQLVESFGTPSLAQAVRDALSGAEWTEFRIGGVLRAIGTRVDLMARLERNGKTVRTWTRQASKLSALEAERDLAHDVVRALWEQGRDETAI